MIKHDLNDESDDALSDADDIKSTLENATKKNNMSSMLKNLLLHSSSQQDLEKVIGNLKKN
jgi:DNA-binding transcriptional regulator GbsR (MarR family)